MARTNGALLSFGASGKIADTQVYASWRGIPYARRYVIPANPNTAGQQTTRNTFKWANASWLYLPAIAKEPWTAYAQGRPFVPRNGWVSRCVALLRGQADNSLLEGSPGVNGGLPIESMTLTPGVGQIVVDFTTPTPPSGWNLISVQAVIMPKQDPGGLFTGPISAGEDTVTKNQVTFAGLVAATEYVVSGWAKWDRGGGKYAYSISVTDTATAN